jgi:hypothetical protein
MTAANAQLLQTLAATAVAGQAVPRSPATAPSTRTPRLTW